MSRRGLSFVGASVSVDFNEKEFFQYFNSLSDKAYKEMAKRCKTYAVSHINSHTGNLALSVRVKKSKFPNGGYICIADGGNGRKGHHAFLVEYGTEGPRKPLTKPYMKFEIDGKVIRAKVVAKMPAKPFMRPARDRVVEELKAEIAASR